MAKFTSYTITYNSTFDEYRVRCMECGEMGLGEFIPEEGEDCPVWFSCFEEECDSEGEGVWLPKK